MIKDSLNGRCLPPLVHYKKAKTFEEMSMLVLEIAKVDRRFNKTGVLLLMLESGTRMPRIELAMITWLARWRERRGALVSLSCSTWWTSACLSLHSCIDFNMDHPFHGLYRAHSTTSDWSDCTLPAATAGNWNWVIPAGCDADKISENVSTTDGRDSDTPTQHFLNLPSSLSSDHLSSNLGEGDNSSSCKTPFSHRSSVGLNMVIN